MKKVIEFLTDGHPVRIFVTAKKPRLKIDPFCVEETTIRVLDAVEEHVQVRSSLSHTHDTDTHSLSHTLTHM